MLTRGKRIVQMVQEFSYAGSSVADDLETEEKHADEDNFEGCEDSSEYIPPESSLLDDLESCYSTSPTPSYSSSFEEARELIAVESPLPQSSKLICRTRRKHYCTFCNIKTGNFSRHLVRNHADELEVQKFMAMNKNSRERKKLIDRIRRQGDFETSTIIPVMEREEKPVKLIVCSFCRGYYSSKTLRRHTKKCFFNPDPSKKFNAQREGHTVMCGYFGPKDPLITSGLLQSLKADNISFIAKKDEIICEVGRRYIKRHKSSHLLLVAKRYMRRLARLLQSVREIQKNDRLKLIDVLCPQKFKTLVEATRSVAGYNGIERSFRSSSLAFQMGTLLKYAVDTSFSLEIQKQDPRAHIKENLSALKTLIETDWNCEISSEAGQNIALNKFNKSTVIPAAEDIKKFDIYLKGVIKSSMARLTENSRDFTNFRKLMNAIFCSLLLFNRRRVSELQRIPLSTFKKNHEPPSADFQKVLTSTEMILYNSLKRIVIRGKRGRGVPVLFNKIHVKSLTFLNNLRVNFQLESNMYLFGVPKTSNPINGYLVMKKMAELALGDNEKAHFLTSTRLRKHLATITQIFNMEKTELQQLASFMGHTDKTHEEFYRLPDDIYQTGKISKLLLISQEKDLEKYKGKSLQEIDIDLSLIEDPEEDEEREDDIPLNHYIDSENSTSRDRTQNRQQDSEILKNNFLDIEPPDISSINIKSKKKRVLVPWTAKQKYLTEKFFIEHIRGRIVPKKTEVNNLTEKYPEIFSNKTWQQIKVYVANQFNKKK